MNHYKLEVTCTKVSVEGGISGCSCETPVVGDRDMHLGLRVTVPLGQPEIDQVDSRNLADGSLTYAEVFRLQVPVDVILAVQLLETP